MLAILSLSLFFYLVSVSVSLSLSLCISLSVSVSLFPSLPPSLSLPPACGSRCELSATLDVTPLLHRHGLYPLKP